MANDLEKAVELKRLIDSAHLYLPVVGYCLSLEEEYIKAHDDVIDSDTEGDHYWPPNSKRALTSMTKKIMISLGILEVDSRSSPKQLQHSMTRVGVKLKMGPQT